MLRRWQSALLLLLASAATAHAEPPVAMYIFPAGGRRGTEVDFKVGGLYFHESALLEMLGEGVAATTRLEPVETVWFEGPVIPLPDSQQAEDYPKDYAGRVTIAASAGGAARGWRVWTAQGATASRTFVLGDLPEVVEQEFDGQPHAVHVDLPVTINGRIFPREDVDVWSFEADAGQSVTCTALAASLGSPLEARLEIRDPAGRTLAESSPRPFARSDAAVRFVAPAGGTYQVRIHDLKFGGLQHYVYRLTVTTGPYVDRVFPLGGRRGGTTEFRLFGQQVPETAFPLQLPLLPDSAQTSSSSLAPSASRGDSTTATLRAPADSADRCAVELDEFPEFVEGEGAPDQPAAPFVANGVIRRPGEVDEWPLVAKAGEVLDVETRAARLGAPLDSVVSVVDATGKERILNDDLSSAIPDSKVHWTVPEDGRYTIRVSERDPERGGLEFAYRLRVAPAPPPDFRLHLSTDAVTVPRGGAAKLKLRAERFRGFTGEIALEFSGLPPGVAVANPLIPANAGEVELNLTADAQAKIVASQVSVRGRGTIADEPVVRPATLILEAAGRPLIDTLLVATAAPTPFRVKGVYEVKYAQRGSRFVRRFALQRGGYDGPITVQLADRQMRHLQGVTGPKIQIPPGATEFDYPVFLPPWMEIGRTSRTVVMAVGEIAEADGARHPVSFSSAAQNEQIVALVDPGQLSLDVERKTLLAAPGRSVPIAFRVERGTGVTGEARVELIVPRQTHGVSARTATVNADQSTGAINVEFAADGAGPFNQPLVVRATALKDGEIPFVAETQVEIVAPR